MVRDEQQLAEVRKKITGFQSLSQFNRVFKKLAGKSPTQ
jgi:AraC-like DNA-binding protein